VCVCVCVCLHLVTWLYTNCRSPGWPRWPYTAVVMARCCLCIDLYTALAPMACRSILWLLLRKSLNSLNYRICWKRHWLPFALMALQSWPGPTVEWQLSSSRSMKIAYEAFHCLAHRLEQLAVRDDLKSVTATNHFQSFWESLFALYSQSQKIQRELGRVASDTEIQLHRFTGIFSVRWVVSSFRAVRAVYTRSTI